MAAPKTVLAVYGGSSEHGWFYKGLYVPPTVTRVSMAMALDWVFMRVLYPMPQRRTEIDIWEPTKKEAGI